MSSHLSSIGLPVGSEREFWTLAQRVGPESAGLPVDAGTYFHWRDGSGAELWLQVAGGDQFVGMNPHYAGDSAVPARLTQRLPAADGSPFDGGFRAFIDPGEGADAAPVVFDCPDFLRHGRLDLPADVLLQVAAFAHELDVFDSAEVFAEAQAEAAEAGAPTLSDRFFVAAGLLDAPDAGDLPEARAVFTGHVLASAERANGLTGRRFYWALVETAGGTYDVVADASLVPGGVPPVGGVVSGSFWLSGRVRTD